MSDESTPDVEAIITEIRDRIADDMGLRVSAGKEGGRRTPFNARLTRTLDALFAQADVYSVAQRPGRHPVLGGVVGVVRRALRPLLMPLLVEQTEYNRMNANVVRELAEYLEQLSLHQARAWGELAAALDRVRSDVDRLVAASANRP